ncbi:hypothetical protein MG296_11110 [Flavobacteriaceae bacterium TK19130]|nr:hypothetical protein [Thermobacterium salinum]
MPIYENINGQSNIICFDLRIEAILVTFKTGKTYEYNYAIPGPEQVENMIAFAVNGRGLNCYIDEEIGANHYKEIKNGIQNNTLHPISSSG